MPPTYPTLIPQSLPRCGWAMESSAPVVATHWVIAPPPPKRISFDDFKTPERGTHGNEE